MSKKTTEHKLILTMRYSKRFKMLLPNNELLQNMKLATQNKIFISEYSRTKNILIEIIDPFKGKKKYLSLIFQRRQFNDFKCHKRLLKDSKIYTGIVQKKFIIRFRGISPVAYSLKYIFQSRQYITLDF